jgi:hypothetical protein
MDDHMKDFKKSPIYPFQLLITGICLHIMYCGLAINSKCHPSFIFKRHFFFVFLVFFHLNPLHDNCKIETPRFCIYNVHNLYFMISLTQDSLVRT